MENKIKYSLDMIRIDFELEKDSVQQLFNKYSLDTRVEHWECFGFKQYKHNLKFKCAADNSFWVGCEPLWCKSGLRDWVVCTLEFNPNKLRNDLTLLEVYGSLMVLSRVVSCKRFDLAVDIPVTRSNCILLKDKRKYQEYRVSDSNLTQYLGQRHSTGYVKLYNKAIELGLDDDKLTRLELTVEYEDRNDLQSIFPKVFIADALDMNSLSGTDAALVFGAMLDINILNFLDKRKKKKIKDILSDTSLILHFDIKKYLIVLHEVQSYINKSQFLKGL